MSSAPAPHPAVPPSPSSPAFLRVSLSETTANLSVPPPAKPAWESHAGYTQRARGLVCIPVGRGNLGKTTLGRFVIEQALREGRLALPADGDRINATLAAFRGLGECMRPARADEWSMKDWLGEVTVFAGKIRAGVFADLGGGDRTVANHAKELLQRAQPDLGGLATWNLGNLSAILAEVDLVLLFFLGGGTDDPAGLRIIRDTALRELPLILVLNEGVANQRGEGDDPFAANLAHPEVKTALERGAPVVRIPALLPTVARFIEQNRMTFGEAISGAVGKDGTALTLDQRQSLLSWMRVTQHVLKPHGGLLP